MKHESYLHLVKQSRKAKALSGASSVLGWDQETYMPKEAGASRGEQLKILAGIIHQIRTSKAFSNSLGRLIDLSSGSILDKSLDERKQAAVKQWRIDWKKETSLPKCFVEDFARLSSEAILVWQEARANNNFSTFAPYLDKMVRLCRKKADFLGFKSHPYDALLDEYEPGLTTEEAKELFKNLKNALTDLLSKIKTTPLTLPKGPYPMEKQIAFSHEILTKMGYDFSKGRLDFSAHPFSSAAHPTDSRITTRLDLTNPVSNILTVLHEGGHALYEMGLPEQDFGTPLAEAVSCGMHESQSRFWETRIGLSYPFWKYFLPKLKQTFPSLQPFSLDTFWQGINHVHPSYIRVEADEVTYALHIILRFEMEAALIEGSLKIKDVPEVWNEKTKNLLNITPRNDAEGCLQDIHWSMGGFGYFPSYVIGNLYASHLFEGFSRTFPDWEERVTDGNLFFIKEWLHTNVHRFGRQFSSKELLLKATNIPFSAKAHIDYLTAKYLFIQR